MMLLTVAFDPASAPAMLPHKFSAAPTCSPACFAPAPPPQLASTSAPSTAAPELSTRRLRSVGSLRVDLTWALSPLPDNIEIQSYMRFRPAMLSGSPVCQPARARPLETRMYVTTRPEPIMARAATENSPVASRLLPARLRTHLLAI